MFSRLGDFIAKHWLLTLVAWCAAVVALRVVSPNWDDVTKDGDLAFLPAGMPSVVGEELAAKAFPENRSKSQVVIVFARDSDQLGVDDLKAADRFAARCHNYLAARLVIEAEELRQHGDKLKATATLQDALSQVDEAVKLDEAAVDALLNKYVIHQMLDESEQASQARERAKQLGATGDNPSANAGSLLPLVDVWTRHNEVFGPKLRSVDKQALLIVLQLDTEFMATENMKVLDFIDAETSTFRRQLAANGISGLTVGVSGSAAVGGDMLQSAAESIRNTELFTITLVIVILLLVYRAPLLMIVPLVTIGVSLSVATSLLALVAQWADKPGYEWFGFNIFKTTRIFIVVILFGAGTDFCLFLIARYRECLQGEPNRDVAAARSLGAVADALVASALTTIVGLAMMFFADFGKFRSSGPAIGLCLLVTLIACLTLAPAILRALGPVVFWPFSATHANAPRRSASVWKRLADTVVTRPALVLLVSVALLAPLAWRGWYSADNTTFDLLNALSPTRISTQGSRLLKQHFPVGEGGPVVVFAQKRNAGFDSEERREAIIALSAIFDMTEALTKIEGVSAVRSLAEPLGDPPEWSLLQPTKNILRQHKLTKSIFLAQAKGYQGNTTRFEIVLDHDPFSREAIDTFLRIDDFLRRVHQSPPEQLAFWSDAAFSYAGTTAGIRDLRDVTRSDRWRIQILVVLAVLAVLLVILRRPAICVYLIASVLFSYFVTIGSTELFFASFYGESFQGLDWKVPIFLFVILVAVGEDYNIYLVTRITEEQQVRGPIAGLRAGIVRTGGIITSCGVIMAGTFVSMTAGSLRGIVELGFALSFGVLLDTFVVRTILVPAFIAILVRFAARSRRSTSNGLTG